MEKKLNKLLQTPGNWLINDGPHSDIVLSSRIRLARNIFNLKFTSYMNKEEFDDLRKQVKNAVRHSDIMKNADFFEMGKVSLLNRNMLIERHLISRELASTNEGMLVLNNDEIYSIMVNEEDHLRVQVILPGLQLLEVWGKINQLDYELQKNLKFAFSSEFGFLTACPTNVGTGMRASILIHLPALVLTKQMNKVKVAVEQVGLTVRGYYGEGTESIGNFFQISNQITLGKSEEEISDNIQKIAYKIVNHEQEARKALFKESKVKLEDQIYRAYGILTNARVLTSKEAMALLSLLRLGINIGLITNIPITAVNELLVFTQPAHLQKLNQQELNAEQRDIIRAKIISDKLK